MTKVYLAVGHGEKPDGTHDPGAVGGGWTEQSAGDIIVAETARLLEAAGVEVYSEAYTDDPAFEGTTRQANAWDADYIISIHHDWIKAPEGSFGHWYSPAGKALADDIFVTVGDAGFKLRHSWHKRRTDLALLKNTRAPCVIFEVGRIGQDDLNEERELTDMGLAVAAGIARHLNINLEDDPMAGYEAELAAIALNTKRIAQSTERSVRLMHALASAEVAAIRSRLEMPASPASDREWADRLESGVATLEDAAVTLTEAAEERR